MPHSTTSEGSTFVFSNFDFSAWSSHTELCYLLQDSSNSFLPAIFQLLVQPKVSDSVVDMVLNLVDNLMIEESMETENVADDEDIKSLEPRSNRVIRDRDSTTTITSLKAMTPYASSTPAIKPRFYILENHIPLLLALLSQRMLGHANANELVEQGASHSLMTDVSTDFDGDNDGDSEISIHEDQDDEILADTLDQPTTESAHEETTDLPQVDIDTELDVEPNDLNRSEAQENQTPALLDADKATTPTTSNKTGPKHEFGASELRVLVKLSVFSTSQAQCEAFVSLLTPFLFKNYRVVSDNVKLYILKIFINFYQSFPGKNNTQSPFKVSCIGVTQLPF
jgi:hypothetical protein